jgi:hypothetical protein
MGSRDEKKSKMIHRSIDEINMDLFNG